ncbi:MAG: LuxR C-terminal-related transcriptional regulator [Trueperaceae bacterium]
MAVPDIEQRQAEEALELRVLLVEDSRDDAELNQLELQRNGFTIDSCRVETRDATLEALKNREWDVVLSDHALPGFSSHEVLELLSDHSLDTPCIIVSGAIGEEAAVQLLQGGAVDYVNKDKLYRLSQAVRRALREAESSRARSEAEAALRRSEQALRELNENLELRVDERTRELVAQTNLLEAALNTLKDLFFVVDTDRRLVRWNRELCTMTGLDEDEVENRRLTVLVHQDDREAMDAWFTRVHEDGAATMEAQLLVDSGKYVPYEFTGARLKDGEGHPMGVCGIARNISQRRQTEQHLKQAIREVIDDATWFAQSVLEKMSQVSSPSTPSIKATDLTDRERQVIEMIAKGMKNNQIAKDLGLSYATVRNYVARIYSKLDVHSRAEAVIWARERGFGNQ